MKLLYMLINIKVFCKLKLLFLVGLVRHAQGAKVNFKNEVRNEVKYLTALTGSNSTLTINYTSNCNARSLAIAILFFLLFLFRRCFLTDCQKFILHNFVRLLFLARLTRLRLVNMKCLVLCVFEPCLLEINSNGEFKQ